MAEYNPPIDDIRFAMNDVLDFPAHFASIPGCEDAEPEIVDAIIEESAIFVSKELDPLRRVGDEQGCRLEDGNVYTPDGFKKAWDLYVENGWPGLTQPTEFGGQGLPTSLQSVFIELISSANHAWAMYAGLSLGATYTTRIYVDESLAATYLNPMVEGRWSGTMCLTEANAGSDLGLLRTKASPNDDGSYSISGTKIFISAGDHDLCENIVHIVLARLPNAPDGVRGISLFLVPKMLVNEDGQVGGPNGVSCGSIEHKMGIHGSATCVLNFDKAKGHLLGEPNQGMRQMFTFINESRMLVAIQAQAAIERSYQGAVAYARERLQMRAPVRVNKDKPADPIIAYPDIRRMLLTQRAFSEGGRLLNLFCAQQVDINQRGDQGQKEIAEQLLAVITPIAKGFLTEVAIEATNNGVQVLGGHGYIAESGMEQSVRDVRITSLYEGTTGIQALDLLARKVLGTEGRVLEPIMTILEGYLAEKAPNSELQSLRDELSNKVQEFKNLTHEIGVSASKDPDEVNAAAYDYLMYAGYMMIGYFLCRQADAAVNFDDPVMQERVDTTRFFIWRILPRTLVHAASIRAGVRSVAAIA